MNRWLPWIFLMIVPCMLFPGALPGSRVVSADDHLSVHPAFQETAGGRVRHPQLSDPALHFSALRSRVVAALSKGEVPLWNPDIWAGAPLMGDGQSSVGSPVTWLHLLLPEDVAQDAGVAWVLLWTGLGTALLARRLGAGQWAATIAGAGAMTAPFTQVWLLHPHAATFAWLPWVLLALETRHRPGLALATAGLLMGGHPETAAHSVLIASIWAVGRQRWKTAAVGLPVGLLLSAPVVFPLVEEVLRSATMSAHGGNHLQWRQLLDLAWPGWHGHPAHESWTGGVGIWSDGRLHPGWAVMGLALMGWFRGPRLVRWLCLGWALCLLAACLGLPGPVNHARLGAMGAWLLALAAGLSASTLRHRWLPLTAVAVVATGAWAAWGDQGTLPAEAHAPAPAAWTQALRSEIACTPDTRTASGCGRVLGLGWALQPNTGSLSGLPDIRGYDLPVSWDAERLQRMLRSPPVRPWFQVDTLPPRTLLQFMAVRAVVAPEPIPELPILDLGPAPVSIHPMSPDSPRAWIATAPVHAPDADHAATTLLHAADPARPPVVGLPGRWPTQGQTHPAKIQTDDPNEVSIWVETPTRGVLVLADAWHPGWTAMIDGESSPILMVGGVFRGVVVAPGSHMVRFRFEPAGWTWGIRAGLGGLFWLLGLLWIHSQFRKTRTLRGPASS